MMSKEREFLKKLRYASLLENDLRKELDELLAQPEQTEQEPVAWMWKKHTAGGWLDAVGLDKPSATAHQINIYPLYTAPPKREPLGDEAVCEILIKKEWRGFVDLVRIIEKAHGIGGGE